VAQAIRTAMETVGVKSARLAVCVPAQDVLLRSFTMPLMPKAEWQTAVQFEARKFIPFKTDELVWGFHVVEQRAAKQMVVAFVGMRNESFARIQEWLSAAGVKSAFVEAQAVSLCRLVDDIPTASDLPAATAAQTGNQFLGIVDVDLQANVAHLVIAKDRVPYLARHVDLKQQPEGMEAGSQAGDVRAEVLSSELRLSFDFFTRENPQATIAQLVLFGEQTTIGAWASWLAEQLHCPVALGKLPQQIGELQGLGPEHAAAAGLALRDLQPNSITIDLLARRPDYGTTKARWARLSKDLGGQGLLQALVKPAAVQLVVAVLALGVLAWGGQRQLAGFQQYILQTIAAFPDVGWGMKGKTRDELQAIQQSVAGHLQFLRKLIQERVSVTEKLDALAKALPQGVWLENLRYQDRVEKGGGQQTFLAIRGACFLPDSEEEFTVINKFVQQIKQDPRFFRGFATAQLGEITAVEDQTKRYSYRTFGVNCHAQKPL
jgi:Tfp pilus assembly PilM family ATPase